MPNCRWVLASGTYCQAPVAWRMVPDGGEPGGALVRKYDAFCAEHKAQAEEQEEQS
jgi:hypothetical protein